MKPRAHVALGLAALGAAGLLASRSRPALEAPLAARLAGPFADLAAGVRSVRADRELAAGRELRALDELERALELAPRRTDIWLQLIAAQGLQLASAERTRDARLRGDWIVGALDAAERGLAACEEPEWVARFALGVLRAQAEADPPPKLPPGSPTLAESLERWTRELGAATP